MDVERAPLRAGACLVATVPYQLTHRLLGEVMEHRGCLIVQGEGGTGKTFAVDDYFVRHKCDVVKIHLENKANGYGFLRRLVEKLGGTPWGDGEQLMEELRDAVRGRHVFVYIDEADLLNRDSLRQIRYLRDQRDLHIAFVLVGSNFREAYAKVPELWSRVTRRVPFGPLSTETLAVTLAAFHPLLASADADLLLRIDREHCHGLWRVWATVLDALVDYAERMKIETLTPAVAQAVLGVSIDPARLAKPRGSRPRPTAKVH